MSRILVLAGLCSLGLANFGYAQSRTVVELEGGGGYVFGSGAEDPGPSLPSLTDRGLGTSRTGSIRDAPRRAAPAAICEIN